MDELPTFDAGGNLHIPGEFIPRAETAITLVAWNDETLQWEPIQPDSTVRYRLEVGPENNVYIA